MIIDGCDQWEDEDVDFPTVENRRRHDENWQREIEAEQRRASAALSAEDKNV